MNYCGLINGYGSLLLGAVDAESVFFRKGSLKDWTMLQRAILDRFYSFPWNGVVSKLHQANETSPINVVEMGTPLINQGLSWKFHGLSSEPRLITGGYHLCWGNKHIPQIWWAKLSPIGVSHLHVEVPIAAGRTRDPTFAWSNRVTVWFKGLGKTQKWVVYHGLSSFNVQPESWLRIWKLEAQGPSNFCF